MNPAWRPATGVDAEAIRQIRNSASERFGDPRQIDADQQTRWWWAVSALPEHDFRCIVIGDPVIGFGIVRRRDDGRLWVSLGVHEQARGAGIGGRIYSLLAELGGAVHAAIQKDNQASIIAAVRAGYEPCGDEIAVPGVTNGEGWIVLVSSDRIREE